MPLIVAGFRTANRSESVNLLLRDARFATSGRVTHPHSFDESIGDLWLIEKNNLLTIDVYQYRSPVITNRSLPVAEGL